MQHPALLHSEGRFEVLGSRFEVGCEGLGGKPALGEDLQELVAGNALAAIDLGHTLCEPLVEGGLADFEPFLLGFEQVECLGDDLGGGGIVAAVEFALDALFDCGIEGDRHGGKYTSGIASGPHSCGETA
jgi:hypothetical protein